MIKFLPSVLISREVSEVICKSSRIGFSIINRIVEKLILHLFLFRGNGRLKQFFNLLQLSIYNGVTKFKLNASAI